MSVVSKKYRFNFSLGLVLALCLNSFSAYAENESLEPAVKMGTGWVVAPHFVITNHHVVGNASSVILVRTDNRRIKADVAMRDTANDIAVLKPRNTKLLPPGLPVAAKTANVGASIFTIGYPLVSIMGREPKLTTGYVSARTGLVNDPRIYQISVPIQPGNSGGPVFNMQGEVIGIATSSLDAAKVFKWAGNIPQNVNYAVKSHYVNALLGAMDVNSENAIKTLEVRKQELESLVMRVKSSVLLVIATDNTTMVDNNSIDVEPAELSPSLTSVKKYSLIVHVKPSGYDLRWGNTTIGLDHTTDVYSKTLADFMVNTIKKQSKDHVVPKRIVSGRSAARIIYKAYKNKGRARLCESDAVDFLLSAKNETSSGKQDITYYVYNCKLGGEFYFSKPLGDNRNDHFLYETELKRNFQRMLTDLPSNVRF